MEKFQVDLHGIVQILSRHLYSSPRVFVRELLQNGVDAITARRQLHPGHAGHIEIVVHPAGTVTFTDNGIGLTAAEVRELLATIGRSSKRDELDLQREGFLGQFGIGLLSCFLVSDTIEVRTRSAAAPDAETLVWTARGDGTYELTESAEPLAEPGTTVTLRPRVGEHWLRPATVKDLAHHYGALLTIPISVVAGEVHSRIAPHPAPWDLSDADAAAYCAATFGFAPMAMIPLEVPVAGVTGVAFVQPTPANPTEGSKHRVYLRRMLLGESVQGLLPDWASFARVVVDVEALRPTASRESLFDDEILAATRTRLGAQLRRWLTTTHATDPPLLRQFIDTHRLSVCAAALHDDEVLSIVRDWMPWYTSTGTATMSELLRGRSTILFAATTKTFDGLQSIAAARGTTVVNAGYTYAIDLLRRFAALDPSIVLRGVTLTDLVDDTTVDPALSEVVRAGSAALRDQYCEVSARPFEPRATPALYVRDPDRAAATRAENRRSAALADPVLAGLLGGGDDGDDEDWDEPFDTLVLNTLNPVVALLPTLDPGLIADVVRHLYATSLFSSGMTLGDQERELLTDSLVALIERTR